MHNNRYILNLIAATAILLALCGCATPKHTNVLMFGTNTKIAIDVGYDPKSQDGGILVGYKRQEAVWMPLLVNSNATGDAPAINPKDGSCTANGSIADHLYQGKATDGSQIDSDTYSVLATLGAKFGGSSGKDGTGKKADGAISQYFATGLAARILAEKGGADLVTITSDEAAKARAESAKAQKAETELKLAQFTAANEKRLVIGTTTKGKLLAHAASLTDDELGQFITKLKEAGGIAPGLAIDDAASQRSALQKITIPTDSNELKKLTDFADSLQTP